MILSFTPPVTPTIGNLMGIVVVSNLTNIVAPSGWTGNDSANVGPNAFSLCFYGVWTRVCDGTETFPQQWTVGNKHVLWYWEWSGATAFDTVSHATGLSVGTITAPLPNAVSLNDLVYVLYVSPGATVFTPPALLITNLQTSQDQAFGGAQALGISSTSAGVTTASAYTATMSATANAIAVQFAIKGSALAIVAGASMASS